MSFITRIKNFRPSDFHWSIVVLLTWGAAVLGSGLLRFDAYGIEEGAARALLIIWSLSDRVISTAFIMGIPDLRPLVYLPLGLYWPGSLLAAKVYTLLLAFLAILVLYRWQKRRTTPEAALVASGLLLILPGLVAQIDALGAGPYLLLCLATGHWLDHRYRRSERPLGGWFFLQILLVGLTVSLHPAGLAYPLALAWRWYRAPVDGRQQRHVFIGIGLALLFITILRMTWGTVDWLAPPLPSLARALFGPAADGTVAQVVAGLTGLLILALAWLERRRLATDIMTPALVGASLIGLLAADGVWALVAMTTLFHLGIPRLIASNDAVRGRGFLPKRGIVMAVVFIASLLFMQADKAHYLLNERNQLDDTDQLIQTLAEIVRDADSDEVVVMSQWPGRTMLAIRRPVLPLPPGATDAETLAGNLDGISHIVFDPFDEAHADLKRKLALLSTRTETLELGRGGAIVAIRSEGETAPSPSPSHGGRVPASPAGDAR